MSRIAFNGNALGTGTVTIASPNTNSDRTVTLPDVTGTLLLGNGSEGTAGQVFTSNGAGALPTFQAASGFPAGTAMMFVQTAAPTGWTKSTTHNDKALRVVSGTASSGGTTAFSTVFANQTPTITTSGLSAGATTLSTSQIPAHTHSYTALLNNNTNAGGGESSGGTNNQGLTTGSQGGGGSHTHSISGSATSSAITLDVQYVDVIIATKD